MFKRIVAAIIAAFAIAMPAVADEVTEFEGWKFYLTAEACENTNVQFFAMAYGVPIDGLMAGRVVGAKKGPEGEDYSAAMCYMPYDDATIIVVDENGNGGRVPYNPKPVL